MSWLKAKCYEMKFLEPQTGSGNKALYEIVTCYDSLIHSSIPSMSELAILCDLSNVTVVNPENNPLKYTNGIEGDIKVCYQDDLHDMYDMYDMYDFLRLSNKLHDRYTTIVVCDDIPFDIIYINKYPRGYFNELWHRNDREERLTHHIRISKNFKNYSSLKYQMIFCNL